MRVSKLIALAALALIGALAAGSAAPGHSQAQRAGPTPTADELRRMVFLWRTPDGTLWLVTNAAPQHIQAITPRDMDDVLTDRIIDPPAPDGWTLYPAAAPTATPAWTDEAPLPTLTGAGNGNTRPFALGGGDYRVAWTATPDAPTGCGHYGEFVAADGNESLARFGGTVKSATPGPVKAETWVYGVRPGRYYLHFSSGCREWSASIARG